MLIAFGLFRPAPARSLARAVAAFCASLALSVAAAGQQQPTSPAPSSNPSTNPTDAGPTPTQTISTAAAPNPSIQDPSTAPSIAPSQQPSSSVPPVVEAISPALSESPQSGATTEDDLKKLLVGKVLYLRGGYLDDNLNFNEHGVLSGHSPQGSYTLSGVSIDKVRLTKHKVELEGQRYGLHFLGASPSEDPATTMDRVLITPKKKVLRITIDRETVITPKKSKDRDKDKKLPTSAPASPAPKPAASAPATAQLYEPTLAEPSEADQAKTEIAAAPPAERPADPASVTTTTSPAHAAGVLKEAIDHIFSAGFDDLMMTAMPDFWKLYYQAVAAKADYKPVDSTILRQNAVDKKARLISVFEPASNEYAQAHGVAGLALYHVVIGADGKPTDIAVARPIGFGLDENAVDSIRKAAFEPATKNGQHVPVLLDLIVEFHIYSGLTGGTRKPEPADSESAKLEKPSAPDQSATPMLPGPYSVPHH